MKKILFYFVIALIPLSAFSQSSASPVVRFTPFLTGYNLWLQTNTVQTATTPSTVGAWYTTKQGQIVQSLTNNYINGGYLSSNVFPSALQMVPVSPDVNGDYNANASFVISIGNTNYIPIAVTNSLGQYFVTNWPLATVQFPSWMYPATTNLYPVSLGGAVNTNTITVNLYKVVSLTPDGSVPTGNNPTNVIVSTKADYTLTIAPTGATPETVVSNLPATLLQGAKWLAVDISCVTNSGAGVSGGILVNQMGIIQPQP